MIESGKIIEILNKYNSYWSTGTISCGIRRDMLDSCTRQLDAKEILLLKGIRRSGKSTLMAQMIGALLEAGIRPVQILRVNLEEPLFSTDASLDFLERIYRLYRDRICPAGRCYLFLDEIQNIPEWERWVRGRNETEDIKIVLTGSSSELLSRETGTKLTGRHLSFTVFPLSFQEFLRFRNIMITSREDYYANKPLVRHLFSEYLRYGGFPEVVLKEAVEDKELLLWQYFEDIVYRDIVSKYGIRDAVTLRNLAVYLMTNIGRLTSISNLKKTFGVSQDKIENYAAALLETCLAHRVSKFSWSLKRSLRERFNIYAVDTGLRNRVAFSFSEDSGWLVENVVLNFLKSQFEEIYFESNGGEIDFVIKEGVDLTHRLQVWYADPADTDIPERELRCWTGSKTSHEEARPSRTERIRNILITNDLEKELVLGETKVECLPVILFLLGK
ncbi:MAG: hypothetical protein A4E74_01696 [Syntrophus sp. PtaB.Bin075]|nr:MAG: hypothetical protein A4E74_01696 [Syntrophus sp. PtaB.Bin075]